MTREEYWATQWANYNAYPYPTTDWAANLVRDAVSRGVLPAGPEAIRRYDEQMALPGVSREPAFAALVRAHSAVTQSLRDTATLVGPLGGSRWPQIDPDLYSRAIANALGTSPEPAIMQVALPAPIPAPIPEQFPPFEPRPKPPVPFAPIALPDNDDQLRVIAREAGVSLHELVQVLEYLTSLPPDELNRLLAEI